MNRDSRMCSACKYVYGYISNKMCLERERIIDKILMEQNKMLHKKFTKIIMIHNEVDHKISLFELMRTTEIADQIYDKISMKLQNAIENILINEIMDLELCCEEKVFKKSRDIIEGLEF